MRWSSTTLSKIVFNQPRISQRFSSARVEATNILRRLERAKEITLPEASAAQEDLMQLSLELFSFDPFADRVWEL